MKLLYSTTILLLISGFSFAQQVKTEFYENGTKKSEGVLLGADNDSPQDIEKQSKDVRYQKSINAFKDGKWTYWFENGQLSAEQYYNKGEMTGVWKSWYKDGKLGSEVNLTKGTAMYWYANGNKSSEGKMSTGMHHEGNWTGWYENGNKNYEGAYINGQKEGTWKWYNEKGEKLQEEVYKAGALISSKKN